MKTKIYLLIGVLFFSLSSSNDIINFERKDSFKEITHGNVQQETPQSSLGTTLGYEEDISIHFVAEGRDVVDWSFSGSHSLVDITVVAMDSSEYYHFNNGDPYTCRILSDGNSNVYSGSFTVPYTSGWRIIFFNWDEDMMSTDLIYDALITHNYFGGTGTVYGNYTFCHYPGESGSVDWEFEGSNTIVGITALVMSYNNLLELLQLDLLRIPSKQAIL